MAERYHPSAQLVCGPSARDLRGRHSRTKPAPVSDLAGRILGVDRQCNPIPATDLKRPPNASPQSMPVLSFYFAALYLLEDGFLLAGVDADNKNVPLALGAVVSGCLDAEPRARRYLIPLNFRLPSRYLILKKSIGQDRILKDEAPSRIDACHLARGYRSWRTDEMSRGTSDMPARAQNVNAYASLDRAAPSRGRAAANSSSADGRWSAARVRISRQIAAAR
jgi:hypothetical protein